MLFFEMAHTNHVIMFGLIEKLRSIKRTPKGYIWIVECLMEEKSWIKLGVRSIICPDAKAVVVCNNKHEAEAVKACLANSGGSVRMDWHCESHIAYLLGNGYALFTPTGKELVRNALRVLKVPED